MIVQLVAVARADRWACVHAYVHSIGRQSTCVLASTMVRFICGQSFCNCITGLLLAAVGLGRIGAASRVSQCGLDSCFGDE